MASHWVRRSLLGVISLLLASNALAQETPTVKVVNGTYSGIYSAEFSQDQFLGIPFVQPPLGDLRLQNPQPLNTSWDGVRPATSYGPSCFGLNQSEGASEDCLNLNIVRPAGLSKDAGLAVAVWIYGGGFSSGSNSQPTYNLSNFVQQSQEMGTPVIAVSVNYRLHCWGYMWSNEIKDEGVANLGFKDQRLALHWIQENIGAFGGDPLKVTIFGESAGGNSVGTQLIAYGGRDDKLFRAAISQSGAPSTYYRYQTADDWQPFYDAIVNATGCQGAQNTLACLRTVDTDTLYEIFNDNDVVPARTSIYSQAGPKFVQVIDGDFIEESATVQLAKGKFVHVPYILGGNKDESTTFAARGVNTTQDFLDLVIGPWEVSENATSILAALYPDIPGIGSQK
ncbi:Lipase 1 [Cyphellophora attinorum]|uniref:Carboxylic ester hydrolase n=1 Tax=Cyphellophora attinorum TaxID=1664694 RepID=A0A0N1P209_9EURO|nr:Lipase 1 [Phialophora attinorum]KPI42954.1 Lipase 1 [Phialophora attinorum]